MPYPWIGFPLLIGSLIIAFTLIWMRYANR